MADAPARSGRRDGTRRVRSGIKRRADHRLFAAHPYPVGDRGLVPGQIGGRTAGMEPGPAARSSGLADRDDPVVDRRLGYARDRDDSGVRLCRIARERRAHCVSAARHRDVRGRPRRRRRIGFSIAANDFAMAVNRRGDTLCTRR